MISTKWLIQFSKSPSLLNACDFFKSSRASQRSSSLPRTSFFSFESPSAAAPDFSRPSLSPLSLLTSIFHCFFFERSPSLDDDESAALLLLLLLLLPLLFEDSFLAPPPVYMNTMHTDQTVYKWASHVIPRVTFRSRTYHRPNPMALTGLP